MKSKIKTIILFVLLIFNVVVLSENITARFAAKEVLSKDVTIVDKYSIGGDNDYYFETHYMKGEDDNGEVIVIVGNKYDIGDKVTVYADKSMVKSAEWQTDVKAIARDSDITIILFLIFTVINIGLLVSLRRGKKSTNVIK